MGKKGRAYEYDASGILVAISDLLRTAKLRQTTKNVLTELEVKVRNTIEVNSFTPDQELLDAMKRVSESNARFEQTARRAREVAEDYKAYKAKTGQDFSPKNNVVAFSH